MKDCEPLRGKINFEMLVYSDTSNFGDRYKVIEQYQKLAKDVASAFRFYKKYKDNPAKLGNEEPEHYKRIMKAISKGYTFVDYCFGDVIKE